MPIDDYSLEPYTGLVSKNYTTGSALNKLRQSLIREAATRGKYAPLYHFLVSQISNEEWHTTFHELESILGFHLPDSARLHRPWWANPKADNGHSHALAWQAAGWKTRNVNIDAETLIFAKLDAEGDATAAQISNRDFHIEEILPPHDAGPWPPGFKVSREELYEDDGSLTPNPEDSAE